MSMTPTERAEATLADWPKTVQPLLRQGVKDKIVAAIEAAIEVDRRDTAKHVTVVEEAVPMSPELVNGRRKYFATKGIVLDENGD